MAITRATEVAYTITLASLATNGIAQSNAITPGGEFDHLVQVDIASITPTEVPPYVNVYVISSNDNTTFDDTNQAANMRRLGSIDCTSMAQARSKSFSVAAAFGGMLPKFYKLAVENKTGVSFAASGNSAGYVAQSA